MMTLLAVATIWVSTEVCRTSAFQSQVPLRLEAGISRFSAHVVVRRIVAAADVVAKNVVAETGRRIDDEVQELVSVS